MIDVIGVTDVVVVIDFIGGIDVIGTGCLKKNFACLFLCDSKTIKAFQLK